MCSFLQEKVSNEYLRNLNNPCGQFIGIEDQNNIQYLVIDFIVNGLIPHLSSTLQDIASVIEHKRPNKSVLDNARSFFSSGLLSKSTSVSTLLAMKLR